MIFARNPVEAIDWPDYPTFAAWCRIVNDLECRLEGHVTSSEGRGCLRCENTTVQAAR